MAATVATINSLRVAPSIILIHGIGILNGSFQSAFLKRELQLLGQHDAKSIHEFSYTPATDTLDVSGSQLKEYIKSFKPYSPIDPTPCHFVTCDYGSLVLREAFRQLDWDSVKSSVAMIGPPNGGCQRLKSKFRWCGRNYVATEELLKMDRSYLDSRLGPMPKKTKTLVISGSIPSILNQRMEEGSPNDGVLTVEETLLPKENLYYQQETINAPHFLLPYHPKTVKLINSLFNEP